MELFSIRALVGLCVLIGKALCDYKCVCSHQMELEIYEKPDTSSGIIGYMYEYDCNPLYVVEGLDSHFIAIGNKGMLGYVQITPNVQVQTCHGSVPGIDKVVMATTPSAMIPLTTTTTTTTTRSTTPTAAPSSPPVPPGAMGHTSSPMTTTPIKAPTKHHIIGTCPNNVVQQADRRFIAQHGKYCYEYVPRSDIWIHAQENCRNKSGHMLSIENQDQQNFITSFLYQLHISANIWLGYSERTNEEQWRWDSGISSSYSNWMPGRYIDAYHEQNNCGILVPLRHGMWDDIYCDGIIEDKVVSHSWICQYSIMPI